MYIVAIDIGTQGTKAALFDEELNVTATAFEASKMISPSPGTVWQEPDDLYMSCVRTIRELMQKAAVEPANIAAIGIDGQMAGIMGIGSDGEAVTPFDSWLDTRCDPYVHKMRDEAGDKILRITGGPVSIAHGPKILWWKHERPDVYRKLAKFVMPHAYVAGKMAGLGADEAYIDYTHLHFSGFADNARKTWSAELTDTFHVSQSKLPRIVSPFAIIGSTSDAFSTLAGLRQGIPIAAGCGDTAASIFGAGMTQPGMLLDCAGTASVLSCVTDDFRPDSRHETITTMRNPIDGLYLPLAYLGGGGMCVRWFRDQLSGTPSMHYDELQKEAEAVIPSQTSPIFVPHFAGRALPIDPTLKGGFIGLDFKHGRGELFRSVLESVAFEYHGYLKILKDLYPQYDFQRILTIGGGAQGDLFNQIKADVLGMDIQTLKTGDTSLMGTAAIAGNACGLLADCQAVIRSQTENSKVFHSNPEQHQIYEELGVRYRKAVDAFADFCKNDQ